jgi:hypothetical protein
MIGNVGQKHPQNCSRSGKHVPDTIFIEGRGGIGNDKCLTIPPSDSEMTGEKEYLFLNP